MALVAKRAIKIAKPSNSRDDSNMQNTCLILSTTSTAFLVGASLRPVVASCKASRCVRFIILKRHDPQFLLQMFWGQCFILGPFNLRAV